MRSHPRRRTFLLTLLACLTVGTILAGAAHAQPFGIWMDFNGAPGHYVSIPDSSSLTPAGAFTFEAWVDISNNTTGEDCRSIAGKDWMHAWWVGLCNVGGQPTLRSYLRGGLPDQKNGGYLTRNQLTHVAVVYDGVTRKHYINGELAATFAEFGALPSTPGTAMRIGSDESWDHPPSGSIFEVRLWSVARTQAELRANINVPIRTAQAGLIAVWTEAMTDAIDSHSGSIVGGIGPVHPDTFPVTLSCGSSPPCIDGHFFVTTSARTGTPQGPDTNTGVVRASSPNSLVFSFFDASNWELLVKSIDACSFNHRYWLYSAATTDRYFRMQVLDVRAGTQKIYFNYPGPPAPAVTDSDAFNTCP